jgi:hypothetical protein
MTCFRQYISMTASPALILYLYYLALHSLSLQQVFLCLSGALFQDSLSPKYTLLRMVMSDFPDSHHFFCFTL